MNMPEIVFVMTHDFSNVYREGSDEYYKNICGTYVTNKGELKKFDFNKIDPHVNYSLPDVYDQIEEATCDDEVITEKIRLDELLDYYELLKKVDKDAEMDSYHSYADAIQGHYNYYGVRSNEDGTQEIVYLSGGGDWICETTDENAEELYYTIGMLLESCWRKVK
ncbi:MAG: hypothetical protein IJF18_02895 [Oscillospiraceae bacterium]|nr:hypothetical protein [Oscillospiraceae bacterium]